MSNLENIEYVVKHSKHVKINKNRLEEFSKKFKSQKVSHYLDIENITNLNLNQICENQIGIKGSLNLLLTSSKKQFSANLRQFSKYLKTICFYNVNFS